MTYRASLCTSPSLLVGNRCVLSILETVVKPGDRPGDHDFGDVAIPPIELDVPAGDPDDTARSAADEALEAAGWIRTGGWGTYDDADYADVEPETPATTHTVSHTQTYHPITNGLADLALPLGLENRLIDALDDSDINDAVATEIGDRVTEQIQRYGVVLETGEWLGEWSAEKIVRTALHQLAPRTEAGV